MPTAIEISSNALILIGDNPISSFTEPGAGATAAANLYPETYKMVLATHPWTFALKELRLSQLSAEPDPLLDFQFAYQLPPDHIRTWALFPISNYVAVGGILYSNENEILLRYIFQAEETSLPPHFVKALEYALAADFAQLITENTSKSQFFEGKYLNQLGRAMATDSQGHPQQPIIDNPFVDVRTSGRSFGRFD